MLIEVHHSLFADGEAAPRMLHAGRPPFLTGGHIQGHEPRAPALDEALVTINSHPIDCLVSVV